MFSPLPLNSVRRAVVQNRNSSLFNYNILRMKWSHIYLSTNEWNEKLKDLTFQRVNQGLSERFSKCVCVTECVDAPNGQVKCASCSLHDDSTSVEIVCPLSRWVKVTFVIMWKGFYWQCVIGIGVHIPNSFIADHFLCDCPVSLSPSLRVKKQLSVQSLLCPLLSLV